MAIISTQMKRSLGIWTWQAPGSIPVPWKQSGVMVLEKYCPPLTVGKSFSTRQAKLCNKQMSSDKRNTCVDESHSLAVHHLCANLHLHLQMLADIGIPTTGNQPRIFRYYPNVGFRMPKAQVPLVTWCVVDRELAEAYIWNDNAFSWDLIAATSLENKNCCDEAWCAT